MKYRISKYDIFPPQLDDVYAPTWAVEVKKHWWSKWKSIYWTTDTVGNRIPMLFTKSQAIVRLFRLTKNCGL